MASISDFVPVRRELIKNTPPKPFLIGVAGGSASGKVKITLQFIFHRWFEEKSPEKVISSYRCRFLQVSASLL